MKYFLVLLLLQVLTFSNLPAKDLVHQVSVKDQVAQLMVVHVQGDQLNDELKSFFSQLPVGGIILYPWANGLKDSKKTKGFCEEIKKYFKLINKPIPWFFVDEEGGVVSKLQFGDQVLSPQEVAKEQTPLQAYSTAETIAKKLYDHGIQVNLAPVVDIPSVQDFPYKSRVFSNDAHTVIRFADSYLQAFKDHHVLGCLKHFPGHGRAELDSHADLPTLNASYDELWDTDWLPYRELKEKTPFVMTAHLLVPSLDSKPATISKKIVTGILKDEIGYQGLVITDSLMMKGILKEEPEISKLAFMAFDAGHDMLLFGGAWLIDGILEYELSKEDLIQINRDLISEFLSDSKAYRRLQAVYQRVIDKKEEYKF